MSEERRISPLRNPEVLKKFKNTRRMKYNGQWYSEEGLKKIIKNLPNDFTKPTEPERLFIRMTKKYRLPFRYVGNGSFWVGKMNPDFVHNHENKVVEIYGDFWHQGEDPQERIDAFAKYGWDCMVIWEHDLREKEDEVLRRIVEWLS